LGVGGVCWDGAMPRTRGERHRHARRGQRQVDGGQTKGRFTPGKSSRGVPVTRVGYLLRRPELAIVGGILAAGWFVVMAIVVGERWIVLGAVFILAITAVVWFTREWWRDNAERARVGNRPFF